MNYLGRKYCVVDSNMLDYGLTFMVKEIIENNPGDNLIFNVIWEPRGYITMVNLGFIKYHCKVIL